MAFDKIRFRFCKSGDLRFLSHLDLMRAFERMIRRADLPIKSTQGFHPAPRLVVPLSLSLGIVGWNEILEAEFTTPLDPQEVLQKLQAQQPPGLYLSSAIGIPMKSTARIRRAFYRVDLPSEQTVPDASIEDWLASSEYWVYRKRPKEKLLNIRPYVEQITPTMAGFECSIWITPEGTTRIDEIAKAFGLGNILQQGWDVNRTDLEVTDELDPTVLHLTPTILPETRPVSGEWREEEYQWKQTGIVWGATSNGPIVE